jgi:nucleoside-diphosphate-sugar epimerase/predicted dehydrogenase
MNRTSAPVRPASPPSLERQATIARTATKVGLLGAGYILDAHAYALAAAPGVALHAVCDLSRARAQHAATKFGIPHVLGSIKELAASDCDVVHVLLPPALHIEAALAMVEAGKSVFLEKPMGLDSGGCAALSARAAEKGVALGVNHNFLFSQGFESLRASVRAGELGRLDHVAVSWHLALPILKFGPFDSWMLAAPANIVFELGSHIGAFVVDLLGMPEITCAVAGDPLAIPGGRTVYRQWTAVGRVGRATATLSISISGGHADRFMRIRGRGGSAQLDFGRDIGWREFTVTENPILDSHAVAAAAGRTLHRQARHDRIRRLKMALARGPAANPFEESVSRSISAFYREGLHRVDPRHSGRFATDVIRLCEAISAAAKVGQPSSTSISVRAPHARVQPTVLVVGGTGFIGRRLVRALIERGQGVRVLTRNAQAAAVEFEGLPVELFAGSHGDPESAERALAGIKVVYHLAKCEGKRWQDYLDGDVRPTRVLAEAAVAAGVERFIYTGTIASYASDDAGRVIDNRTPLDSAIRWRDLYGRSKAACEQLLQAMHRERGLPLVIVRPGIVIGPGSPPAHPGVACFISETRVDYWGRGTTPLPLVLVDDVADALARALDARGIDGQTLLLTSPPLLTAREYVEALSAHLGLPIDARARSPWSYWAADMVKELAKHAMRHPNRRWPSLHDCRCRSHAARYDGRSSQTALGWQPVADRQTMVARGISAAVDWFLR